MIIYENLSINIVSELWDMMNKLDKQTRYMIREKIKV